MKHLLRTRLNQVKPDLAQTIDGKQNKQKKYMDLKGHQDRVFVGNDIVLVRNTESLVIQKMWILGLWTQNLLNYFRDKCHIMKRKL